MKLFHFSQADLDANRQGEILPHQRYPIGIAVIFLIVFLGVGVGFVFTAVQSVLNNENRGFSIFWALLFIFGCVVFAWMLVKFVRQHYETQVCVSEDEVYYVQQKSVRQPHHFLMTNNHRYETNIDDLKLANFLERGRRYRIYYPCGVKTGEAYWLLSLEPIEETSFHEFDKP